ncbi:NAD-binding protein [Kitasatospora indigofera]|uniref:NAD-binding protein n=1 Tax=Kitasatospora indigofera TaxID=67307 RepID=UPI003638E4E1
MSTSVDEPNQPTGPSPQDATVPSQRSTDELSSGGHMVICGDDALAHRLAVELARLYGQRVTVVLPSLQRGHGPQLAALASEEGLAVDLVEAGELDRATLIAAGVEDAVALALTSEDDQANLHAGLRARRINPGLRLVLRVYNRKLGQRVEQLLDRAALARQPELSQAALAASTTVLSASATVAPALVAAALAGRSHVVPVDGRLLRVAEIAAGRRPEGSELAVLAVPSTAGGRDEELLLPSPDAVESGAERVVLELLGRAESVRRPRRLPGLGGLPMSALFSARLRWSLVGLVGLVAVFAALTTAVSGHSLRHSVWLVVLDVLGIDDPAEGAGLGGKVLQIMSAVSGMLLMPLLIALALDALGTFRTVTALRRPARGLSGHVVLIGLGRVGSRVLERLWELDVPTVCIDHDPAARGIARARAYGTPVVIGDATQEGVLEAAKIHRARALLTVTSDDSTNLEAALYARECNPDVRAVLRLFDDDFAGDIYRALRDSYPQAETRSRSVSFLAAPSFASAMMGRQVIGAIAIGRRVLLIAAVEVTANSPLSGRTVADAHRPGWWRILAVDLNDPAERRPDLADPYSNAPELLWNPTSVRMLCDGDRVVIAVTREGLGLLLAGHDPRQEGDDGPPEPAWL